jgi:predicted Rossmann-fold nucleotide-binding protein
MVGDKDFRIEGRMSDEDRSGKEAGDSISLGDESQALELIRQSIQGLREVVNNLTRLRPMKRTELRVTVFGSARIPSDHWVYGAVRDLAAELARMGCGIVTGGGSGTDAGRQRRCGLGGLGSRGPQHLHPDSPPVRAEINPFVREAYEHRTFFSRLHHFTLVSDAFVVVPGGIGTVLELAMVWQLLQVRKLHQTPLILIGCMWADFVAWGVSTC